MIHSAMQDGSSRQTRCLQHPRSMSSSSSLRKRRRHHSRALRCRWFVSLLSIGSGITGGGFQTSAFVVEPMARPWKNRNTQLQQHRKSHHRMTEWICQSTRVEASTSAQRIPSFELCLSAIEPDVRATEPRQHGFEEHVWIWEGEEGTWNRPEESPCRILLSQSAQEVTSLVRNWCEGFVLALDLCPWAKASLQTKDAMRFFLVPPPSSDPEEWTMRDAEDAMDTIVEDVAMRFQREILHHAIPSPTEPSDGNNDGGDANSKASVLEKAAIYFVVFLPPEAKDVASPSPLPFVLSDSFVDFIDWFTELEEHWSEDLEDVIVAPFHPSWEFGGGGVENSGEDDGNTEYYDEEACLDYEKRSPYPLVTLVSTNVVEQAGEAVTKVIGEHNQEILLGIEAQHHHQLRAGKKIDHNNKRHRKSHCNTSVAELWWSAVYGKSNIEP